MIEAKWTHTGLRFQTGVKIGSVHMKFRFGCISKRPDILMDISFRAVLTEYFVTRNKILFLSNWAIWIFKTSKKLSLKESGAGQNRERVSRENSSQGMFEANSSFHVKQRTMGEIEFLLSFLLVFSKLSWAFILWGLDGLLVFFNFLRFCTSTISATCLVIIGHHATCGEWKIR